MPSWKYNACNFAAEASVTAIIQWDTAVYLAYVPRMPLPIRILRIGISGMGFGPMLPP